MNDLAARIARLPPRRRELLLRKLEARKVVGVEGPVAIPTQPPTRDRFPLSPSQLRVWLLVQLDPTTPAYNLPASVRLLGQLDQMALVRALQLVVARHGALRTAIVVTEDGPEQHVLRPNVLPLPVIDLGALSASDQKRAAARAEAWFADALFDLARASLMRVALVRFGGDRRHLLYTMHHIISDGWSMAIFAREVSAAYGDLDAGRPPRLPAMSHQYPDYACWQRQELETERLAEQVAFWRRQLADLPPAIDLPTDRPRPARMRHRGARVPLTLSPALTAGLRRLATGERATLFMTLVALLGYLLQRYSGQRDLALGTYTANRGRAELEPIVGFFVNTLVLRTHLASGSAGRVASFRHWLGQVREITLGAFAHQEVPFERVVKAVQPERDLGRTPLFQVMLMLQSFPRSETSAGQLTMSPLPLERVRSHFDLTLLLVDDDAQVSGYLEYDADLFEDRSARRLARQLQSLAAQAVAEPDRPLCRLRLDTRHDPAVSSTAPWRGAPPVAVEVGVCACAHATPDAWAVEQAGAGLTYGELMERVELLALRLRALGIGPERVVAVALERSIGQIVAVLAVLEAGGCYLPLDPGYPEERLAWMLADAGAELVLTGETPLPAIAARAPKTTLALTAEGLIAEPAAPATTPVGTPTTRSIGYAAEPEQAAYVLYTSGSTGRPKGVLVPRRALAAYTAGAAADYEIGAHDRVLQFASISFDTSAEEIFPCLTTGATLVLRQPEMTASIAGFLDAVGDLTITVLDLPTAFWHELVDELVAGAHLPACVRLVILGGEEAQADRLTAWHRAVGGSVRLVNSYGPTEATIVSLRCDLPPPTAGDADLAGVPIGDAVPGAQVHLLDRELMPVPAGPRGELYLGGLGLARGYLGRPAETAERFVPDPAAERPGARLYRTGDLARARPDGALVFEGRADHQFKVRGYRVEPCEIEAALRGHPQVTDAVVILRTDGAGGSPRLVAYTVAAEPVAADVLRGHLADRLPAHLIPARFVALDELPRTPSGKIDRRALAAPDSARPQLAVAFAPPVTAVEKSVARVWRELLDLERIGRDDDFFSLGGDSLVAVQVIARLRRALAIEVPVTSLFAATTVRALAARIESDSAPAVRLPPIARQPADAPLEVSYAQRRMWFMKRLAPDRPIYLLATGAVLRGALDLSAMAQALCHTAARHEVLRTAFVEVDGEPRPRVEPARPMALPMIDLSALPPATAEATAEALGDADARRIFDLSRAPLLRVTLLRLATDHHRLLGSMDHLITDGWSVQLLFGEVFAGYRARISGQALALPALAVQYTDYAAWQRQQLEGSRLETLLGYWRRQLAGEAPPLALPIRGQRTRETRQRAGNCQQALPAELGDRLRKLAPALGVTPFMLLLAAFQALLHRYSGARDVRIGVPVTGRPVVETEPLIGLFFNTVVIRSELDGARPFRVLLEHLRDTVVAAYEHQDMPFDRLVEALGGGRDPRRSPLFDVMFNFPSTAASADLGVPGLDITLTKPATTVAHIDLTLEVYDHQGTLSTLFNYDADLFDDAVIATMSARYEQLLAAIADDPDRPIAEYALDAESESGLRDAFNDDLEMA